MPFLIAAYFLLQIFLLVILIVGTVRGQGEEASQDAAASCHNIFQTKMSSTTALRYSLKLANNEIKELHVSLNETQDMRKAAQDMLNDAKEKEKEVENEILSKRKYVEELENFIQNLTIEVQELHTTCDSVLAIDCCQVRNANHSIIQIILMIAILFHRLKQLSQ